MVRISYVPLGLMDGIKHSVSREDLFNSLPTSSSYSDLVKKHTTPKQSHKPRTGESRRKVTAHIESTPKQQNIASIRPLENGTASSHTPRREFLPVMNRRESNQSLASSGKDSFTSDDSFHSRKTFPVWVPLIHLTNHSTFLSQAMFLQKYGQRGAKFNNPNIWGQQYFWIPRGAKSF